MHDERTAPDLSVLITCYFEENSIEEFYGRLSAALKSLARSYEIIMVNDGSTDATFEKLKTLFARDPHIRVVMDLFKNAGQQAAITAAITEARGKAIVLMDSDLQLDPADLPLLVAEYDKGYDVVSGYRANRRDSFWRVVPSRLANIIMRRASQSAFRDFGCTFKIYNAKIVRAFEYGPFHVFSNVDLIAKAQRCREVPVSHSPRKYGASGWTFRKLWAYNMDNLMKMLQRPFQWLAAACVAASVLFLIRILAGSFVDFRVLDQVTTGLILNALAFSLLVLLAVLSLIGEFTIRNFISLRKDPAYIVREKLER